MKKSFVAALLITILSCLDNSSFAEIKQIIPPPAEEQTTIEETEYNLVSESGNIQILKQGNKYAIYNKETKKFIIKPILDEISLFNESKPFLYKIIIDGKIGFINVENDTKILTQFQDISVIDNFFKFKKGGKFGLMSQSAEVILPAEYDKINIINQDGVKTISAKIDKKYKMFSIDGKEIAESKLYDVNVASDDYSQFINDIKPEIIDYIILKKREERKANDELLSKDVKSASVEKNVQETVNKTENPDIPAETSEVSYGNLKFFTIKKNNKIGLTTIFGEEIAPMIFDKIDIDTPGNHFKEPIVIGKNDNQTSIYNLAGKELAKMSNNVANVFWHRKTYTYTQVSDRIWDVKYKNKNIGKLVKDSSENKYKFKKTSFTILSMNKANELFINLLGA